MQGACHGWAEVRRCVEPRTLVPYLYGRQEIGLWGRTTGNFRLAGAKNRRRFDSAKEECKESGRLEGNWSVRLRHGSGAM